MDKQGKIFIVDDSEDVLFALNLLLESHVEKVKVKTQPSRIEHPQVVVETSFQTEKRIFRLSVTDNGCGILPDVLDKIFIPFFTTKLTGDERDREG